MSGGVVQFGRQVDLGCHVDKARVHHVDDEDLVSIERGAMASCDVVRGGGRAPGCAKSLPRRAADRPCYTSSRIRYPTPGSVTM